MTGRPAVGASHAVVDVDVHNHCDLAQVAEFLPSKWRRQVDRWGRSIYATGTALRLPARPMANRLDAAPPSGGPAGSDPEFAREQLLDAYGIEAAVLNLIYLGSSRRTDLDHAQMRALNDFNRERWMETDSRWLAAINVCLDDSRRAIAEIRRCVERSDRFVQVLFDSHTERPAGDRRYWPVYAAASALGLPIAFHITGFARSHHTTGVGESTFYYELRTCLAMAGQAILASLIFEGVFARFPDLQIVLTELDWVWAVPFMWRADAAHRLLGAEAPALRLRPSEYVRRQVWWSSQPAVEPEHPEQLSEVWEQFVRAGLQDKLMFASDYPHWDMDSPLRAFPPSLGEEALSRILALNAARLYRLPVDVPVSR